MKNSERVKREAEAEGGMSFDGRPYDMVDWEYEASLPTWKQYWRAKWNLKPRGPMWLPQIIRMTWYLTVINFVLGIHGQIDGDLGGPFFYSRTSCCGVSNTPKNLPKIYDVHYPKTFNDFHVNTTYLRACEPATCRILTRKTRTGVTVRTVRTGTTCAPSHRSWAPDDR